MKLAHIADTHIKNLKYHYEYKIVFEQLYDKLKREKVDYIVHCGDIAHTKTQISPEFVELFEEGYVKAKSVIRGSKDEVLDGIDDLLED